MTISTTQNVCLSPSSRSGFERKRIVLIEDEENDVILMRHAFEKSGLAHEFIILEDSRSAINYLHEQARLAEELNLPCPDLVILDLKLVGSSGFDVLVWIASQPALRAIPVVVFSASWIESDVQRALQLGASEYMAKPSGFEDLMEWGRQLHARWLTGPREIC